MSIAAYREAALVRTDLQRSYDTLTEGCSSRALGVVAVGFKVMLPLLPRLVGLDAMLADALARNTSVVHLIRASTVRRILSLRKMVLTGISHTRIAGNGTAAIDATEATSATFDYKMDELGA